jgi:sugar/nucleoside kinase (ribokinase family)
MSECVSFAGPPVCVVGNINRDVKLLGVPESPGLFLDGETSVSGVLETIGGGGANSACVAAALGASVRFAGKIGDDALGERLGQAMAKHGVTTHLTRDTRCSTGTTVALGFSTGHRHFLSCLPNNHSLSFADLDLTALDGSAHLVRADVWFSQEMLEEGNRRLFAEARRRGLVTSLDINFDPCWSTGSAKDIAHRKELLRGVLELVDIAHGNIRELCEFTASPDVEIALGRLTAWGVKSVVVHMGAEGAGYYVDGRLHREPAKPAERVINSTGTGDVLSMCLILLHHRRDLSLQQKLSQANEVVRDFMEGRRSLLPTF